MIAEIGIIAVSILPVMLVGKLIAITVSGWRWSLPLIQMAVGLLFGFVAIELISGLAFYVIIGTTFAPLFINVLSLMNQGRHRYHALSGEYGQESQWAAELVKDDDDEFKRAIHNLSQMELNEIGIVAESKEELRELTVERYNE